ncbi:MAG: DUF1569 domain-containing protein [Chitinophagales bacterium]
MKSIFDASTQNEIIGRIKSLNASNRALWGNMQLQEMVEHCSRCDDMYLGNIQIPRVFIGRIIGPFLLNKVIQNDAPFTKNTPTSPALKASAVSGDLETQKQQWIARIEAYNNFSNHDFIHPFFGRMNKEQVGYVSYKHLDHHLRQFGA